MMSHFCNDVEWTSLCGVPFVRCERRKKTAAALLLMIIKKKYEYNKSKHTHEYIHDTLT